MSVVAETLPARVQEAFLARIESGSLELPLLPEVASQVMTMTLDSDCDARQLSEQIHRDQAMAGHVLRIANSPLYMPTVPIVSLRQAVSRLGMRKVREIALLITCESRVFKVAGFDDMVQQMFRHSIAAATFAQEIARSRRRNVEEAFLCGLLHDVGRPIALQVLVDIANEMGLPLDRGAVVGAMDAQHCRIGSKLASHWSLPARLGETILYHHEPDAAPTCAQTAYLTRLAADLAHHLVGPKEISEDELRDHPTLEPLNLYSDEFENILALREKVMDLVRELT